MKKKKLFCIISIVLINSLFVFSQTKTEDVYEFPIKPGTEEWWQFETVEKRVESLQIPNEADSKDSTLMTQIKRIYTDCKIGIF